MSLSRTDPTPPVFPRAFWWLGLLLLLLSACSQPDSAKAFRPPTLEAQGERLYLRMEMENTFLKSLLSRISEGSPLFFSYRIRLRQKHMWLPDETVDGLTLKRRVRMHLITRRYRLQDVDTGQETFADDEDEVARFLGHPLYLPLTPLSRLKEGNYFCRIQFRMEDEGVSQVFRVLHRWLTFQSPNEQEMIVEYQSAAESQPK